MAVEESEYGPEAWRSQIVAILRRKEQGSQLTADVIESVQRADTLTSLLTVLDAIIVQDVVSYNRGELLAIHDAITVSLMPTVSEVIFEIMMEEIEARRQFAFSRDAATKWYLRERL